MRIREGLMHPDTMLELSSAPLNLVLAPHLGGCVVRFEYCSATERIPVLRGFSGDFRSVLDAASFPLVPYCNRIRDGRFTFRGRDVTVLQNMKGDPSPLHGQGWLSSWEVARSDSETAELLLRHAPGEWPWAYEARQDFTLDSRGLTLLLSCRNLDAEPMPCGLGQHPYFRCGAETRLDTQVGSAWTIDEKVLPVEKLPATGRYDLRNRRVCGQELDNGFGEWGGSAHIQDPAWPFEITLSSPEASFFQLYSPVDGGIFVAEPVTHANAALNEPEARWAELGLRVLEPGEEMSLTMRMDVMARA